MRVRFLKSIASIYGGFVPGMVADIPNEAIAKSWCRAGIAEEDMGEGKAIKVRQIIPHKMPKVPKEKPNVIPKGMFWCGECQSLHRLISLTGIKHRKHIIE